MRTGSPPPFSCRCSSAAAHQRIVCKNRQQKQKHKRNPSTTWPSPLVRRSIQLPPKEFRGQFTVISMVSPRRRPANTIELHFKQLRTFEVDGPHPVRPEWKEWVERYSVHKSAECHINFNLLHILSTKKSNGQTLVDLRVDLVGWLGFRWDPAVNFLGIPYVSGDQRG